ncbi:MULTISPECIES: amidohydrolase family protein [unclassified Caballeronia]|uniref:amidohydrolase family protein n=1 Tax=unclassified Caballeronia TaxID=2646786 RepID=UPI00285BD0CB|nr:MULTISPECIES: amidohydrolase family protein [unclassified Caballeronia]MDR5754452.1 amidohydrolase family protein [Caballeronia sp. LZ024]MDR5840830.1 amidohydrolase family protein [Caballeronia sp. LZ031]
MNIDAHQHYWDPARGDYGWLKPEMKALYRVFGPDELKPLREAANVARTIVVQAAPTVDETRYLLNLAHNEESIAGVVGWVPLDAPDAPALIETLARDPKFKGVRPMLQDLPDDCWIETAPIEPAIRKLIELDLAFDALIFARHVPSFTKFAQRYPELRIVVDHGAKPPIRDGAAGWQPWADGIAQLAELPQKPYCKLSGLVTEAAQECDESVLKPYVDHLFEHFGAQRLMWGSDWPVLNLNGDYAGWHDAARALCNQRPHLEKTDEAAIFGANAHVFYRL